MRATTASSQQPTRIHENHVTQACSFPTNKQPLKIPPFLEAYRVAIISFGAYSYFNRQLPPDLLYTSKTTQPPDFSPQAEIVTLQLINVFLLLAGLAVVCCFSKDRFVVKGYCTVVALADYGHIWSVYKGLGPEAFWEFGKWNDLVWGGVLASALLNLVRWGVVFDVFGRLKDGEEKVKTKYAGAGYEQNHSTI
ncbi:uncharacterized protein PODANS_3_11575 [Podospora anserina S mat+]|uniref:Podospora anserina S mat+ genomic DNA chromosome 3, supercontig 3 n=2 Tax=Podospora TaxID=5144 RepID=B2ACS7_PODAN|nr:uncharacterized protein PODANS_3_11575 [Podospora anserina S mat+]KAK4683043.1 hypothetical protein QC764_0025360 [Podospora pseudoanserina]CAP61242.1 unnamed protein product [Podospora anserina S mat+]CDP27596.1 Putative protein of unknown function [Podospora anserina S mat+]